MQLYELMRVWVLKLRLMH